MNIAQRLGAIALLTLLAACKAQPAQTPAPGPATVTAPANGRVEIRVDDQGYHPSTIRAAAGSSLTMVFRRADALNCGEKVKFPSLNNMERETDELLKHIAARAYDDGGFPNDIMR